MPSSRLGNTHSRTTSGMACHLALLIAHMVVLHRAWHYIITLILDIRLYYGGRGMPSSPLSSSQGRDMSSVACHHHHFNEYMVGGCRAWHAIIALGQHTQSDDVEHGIPSWPFRRRHSQTFGMAVPSLPLECTHGRTT